ncbi:MAG: tetratricopeptide repeat protein [Sandaracinaceae bacterium]
MSLDRAKVLETAQKHLQKGNYDKAIVEFRKIVQSDPSDIRTWLKIGDLQTRKGALTDAIVTYCKVADQYADQGFFLKAVAVYKQILKLDASRLDIQLKLAEMYENLALVSDALGTYEHVAAGYARAGDIDKALDTLRKMTELDPENIPIRIKCAEALSKAGRTKEAAEEFEAGAELLETQGRIDDYLKVAERLLFHRADDVDTARKVARLYLERSDPKRALAKLQLCFKADPKDIPTLELLAEAFHQLGQLPKTLSVYKEVARIHQEAGRKDERAKILRRVLELDPGDQESRKALAAYASPGGSAAKGSVSGGSVRRDIAPPPGAVIEPSRRAPVDDDEPVMEIAEDVSDEVEILEVDEADSDDILIVEEEAIEEVEDLDMLSVPPEEEAPSVPPEVQREAQIARLLTECDVFMRYGLKQKVADQLQTVLDLDPSHVEARERLKDLYLEEGKTGDAIIQLLELANVLSESESTAAIVYLRQVLELSPDNAEAQQRLTRMGASIPPPAMGARAAAATPAQTPSLPPDEPFAGRDSLDALAPPAEPGADEDDVFFLDDEAADEQTANAPMADATPEGVPMQTTADPLPLEPETVMDAPEPLTLLESVAPRTAANAEPFPDEVTSSEVEDLPSSEELAPPASQRNALPPPPAGSSPPPAAGLRDPLAPMSPEEFEDVPLRPSTPGEVRAEASQRLSMPPGEVEEMLDEADFFVAQGLLEEARGSLTDALTQFPNHPLILEKLREVGVLSAAQKPAPSQSAPLAIEDDQSFELAEKLAAEFDDHSDDTQAGSDVLDVEQVFAQFKKGVESQVGSEDTETHFDLGIAYKEMGLLDDAINEFRLCLTNPTRSCIAATMIGLCHVEKGEVSEAISHFKKGLYADTKTDREELGLYFELGNAYELLHDPKEALYYYQKVQKRDPGFRDVERRIQNLASPSAPTALAPAEQDDIDRAFDDLMGED